MKVLDSLTQQASSIAAIRRDIHAHPELRFEEIRTADLVAQKLTEWGIPIHRGMGTTGVVGILKCGTSERAIGLRADMDALPENFIFDLSIDPESEARFATIFGEEKWKPVTEMSMTPFFIETTEVDT